MGYGRGEWGGKRSGGKSSAQLDIELAVPSVATRRKAQREYSVAYEKYWRHGGPFPRHLGILMEEEPTTLRPRVSLSFKRLSLLSGRISRPFAAYMAETTPQRMEMLLALRISERLQAGLRVDLGVTRSVICRMVAALEKLGWVARRVHPEDRRQRIVLLTEAGRKQLGALFDGNAPDDGTMSVQSSADWTITHAFDVVFAAGEIPMPELFQGDCRAVCQVLEKEQPSDVHEYYFNEDQKRLKALAEDVQPLNDAYTAWHERAVALDDATAA